MQELGMDKNSLAQAVMAGSQQQSNQYPFDQYRAKDDRPPENGALPEILSRLAEIRKTLSACHDVSSRVVGAVPMAASIERDPGNVMPSLIDRISQQISSISTEINLLHDRLLVLST